MPRIQIEDLMPCDLCEEDSPKLFKDRNSGLFICGLCHGEDPDNKHRLNRKKFKDDRKD